MLISSSPIDLKSVSLELFTKKGYRMLSEENTPLLGQPTYSKSIITINPDVNDNKFDDVFNSIVEAVSHGVYPEMIYQGSSGSYFTKNMDHKIVGVFKPKDEEPYGKLNPKWTKWMHKMCCPCCFGRSCLIPNQGYLSEAGASLVDSKFGLNIVPRTKVVRISSETFNYSPIDRAKAMSKQKVAMRFPNVGKHFHRLGLPPKVGSLQLFVNGSRNADYWVKHFNVEPLTKNVYEKFLFQFQKLVCLDYIIRNTDRGNDNWLIKFKKVDDLIADEEDNEEDLTLRESECVADGYFIKIVAIDNGLAFPFKHPDEWRAYPFHWAWIPIAKEPFTEEIKNLFLPKLKDEAFIASLVKDLYRLFKTDLGFDKKSFEKQMSVMRGQILNLSHSLSSDENPVQLVQKPVVTVERAKHHRHRYRQRSYNNSNTHRHEQIGQTNFTTSSLFDQADGNGDYFNDDIHSSSSDEDSNFITKYYQRPYFSWF